MTQIRIPLGTCYLLWTLVWSLYTKLEQASYDCKHSGFFSTCVLGKFLSPLITVCYSIMTYRGSPTSAKIIKAVPHFRGFSLCTYKWGNFRLVESLEQSHLREFCVTRFFSSPKIRVRWGPSEPQYLISTIDSSIIEATHLLIYP